MNSPIDVGAADAPTPSSDARRRASLLGVASLLVALAVVSALLIGGLAALKQRATPIAIAPPLPHPCLQAAPTTQLGVVAVGMAHGNVVLLRASDGQPLWTYHGSQVGATPLIWGQTILVSAETNTVFALAVNDGHVLWRTTVGTLPTMPLGAAPFAIDCGVALVDEAHGGLVALRVSDGRRLWSNRDYPTPQQLAGKLYPYLDTAPLLTASAGIVYLVSERLQKIGRHQAFVWLVEALRETDGRLLWQAQPQQPDPHYREPNAKPGVTLALDTPPFRGAVLGQTLYLIQVATHPCLMAYEAATGALRWRREPAIAVGSLQFNTIENRIYGAPAFMLVVADRQLYLNLGELICPVNQHTGALDACNGLDAPATIGIRYPLLIAQGVTFQPVDELSFGGPLMYIHAYRQSYYNPLWRWQVPGIGDLLTNANLFPLFALARENGALIVGDGLGIYGVRIADGHQMWQWGPINQPSVDPATQDFPYAIAAG